jgi:hypothetical protein
MGLVERRKERDKANEESEEGSFRQMNAEKKYQPAD